MKKIDLNSFVNQLVSELREYEDFGLQNLSETRKTMDEWVDSFLLFSGYSQDEEEDFGYEEYDDNIYYAQDLQYGELVNRRKYRSFRDDDRY
jgi:hypothetical protein